MNTYVINTNEKNEKNSIPEAVLKQFLDVKTDKEVKQNEVIRFTYFFVNAEETEKNDILKKYISVVNICDFLICCKGNVFVKVNTKNYLASEVGKLIKFLEEKNEKKTDKNPTPTPKK